MSSLRATAGVLSIAAFVAACGGGGGQPTTPGGTGAGNPTANGNGGNGGVATPGVGATPAGGEGGGATIRLVNVWAESDQLGPSVTLRLASDPAVILVTAAPGETSAFAEIPAAEFGDALAALEAVPEGSEEGIGLSGFVTGDRVTVIAHGEIPTGGGDPILRIERSWETGEQAVGVPWPTPASETGVIAVFPGPLLALPEEEQFIYLRTEAGACLIDALFDEPKDNGFGGTGATYMYLPDYEPTTIHVGSDGSSECTEIDPDIGTAAVDPTGGKRFGIVVWGMSGEREVLTLDMGTP